MKVGLTSGCFDLFHHSHLRFLESCRSRCDKLIVGVDSDELVRETKGPSRPIHDEMHRFSLVNSLQVVSVAFILRRLEDLDKIAADFDVDELYKCEIWRQRMRAGQTIYGASRDIRENSKPRVVIVPDVPGMVSTTKIIERIRAGDLPVPTREVKVLPVDGVMEYVDQSRHWGWAYNQFTKLVFERDHFVCVLCGKRGFRGVLQADHHPESFAAICKRLNITTMGEAMVCKELWDISNGRTLCAECHRLKHSEDKHEVSEETRRKIGDSVRSRVRTVRMSDCHPNRRHFCKGMCNSCYNRVRRSGAVKRFASCHPDRRYTARGLCQQCYNRAYHKERANYAEEIAPETSIMPALQASKV